MTLKNVKWDSKELKVKDILQFNDVLVYYNAKNKELIDFLSTNESFEEIIELLSSTKDKNLCRTIINIFSPDSYLLMRFTDEKENIENFFHILDSGDVDPFVSGVVCHIAFLAFEKYTFDLFEHANNSTELYCLWMRYIELHSIEYFCHHLIKARRESDVFCWFILKCLCLDFLSEIDLKTPDEFKDYQATTVRPVRLTYSKRIKALKLLYYFVCDWSSFIFSDQLHDALPYLLQDASDDDERIHVFKVAWMTDANTLVSVAAESVLKTLKSSDQLIYHSICYIILTGILLTSQTIELLLFRILKSHRNPFIMKSLARLITFQVGFTEDNKDLKTSLTIILAHFFGNENNSNNVFLKSFRVAFLRAVNGLDVDKIPENEVKRLFESPFIADIDAEYINDLEHQDKSIMNDKSIKPIYSIAQLSERAKSGLQRSPTESPKSVCSPPRMIAPDRRLTIVADEKIAGEQNSNFIYTDGILEELQYGSIKLAQEFDIDDKEYEMDIAKENEISRRRRHLTKISPNRNIAPTKQTRRSMNHRDKRELDRKFDLKLNISTVSSEPNKPALCISVGNVFEIEGLDQ